MRTLILPVLLLFAAGCSSPSTMKRPARHDPLTPRTHKLPTPAQRRSAHQLEASQSVAGRTQVEGALVR